MMTRFWLYPFPAYFLTRDAERISGVSKGRTEVCGVVIEGDLLLGNGLECGAHLWRGGRGQSESLI